MKRALRFTSAAAFGLALVVCFFFIVQSGSAQIAPDPPEPLTEVQPLPLSLGAFNNPTSPQAPLSIADSKVSLDQCYRDAETQTLCFTVYNGSSDGEWIEQVQLTFPNYPGLGAWTTACNSQEPTDSVGYQVNMSCTPSGNQITYADSDADGYGEISNGSSWGFCVDVTVPAGYIGDRIINWGLDGDNAGSDSGQITMEHCTPLWFTTETHQVEGCNAITQTHILELWNYSAGSGTVDLNYEVLPEGSTFTGPSSFQMSNGEMITFVVELTPDFVLKPDQQVTTTLTASSNGHQDQVMFVNTVTDRAGWQSGKDTPVAAMDNVVIWASETDNGLWSIGGYGSDGATQRYDADTGAWQTFQSEAIITPTIEYPVDGCYGKNASGDELAILFPDTIVTDTLHIFNITDKVWYKAAVPSGYPAEGRWGQDVVSMLNHTGENVCYLTGGASQPGGGETRDLWTYYPETNTIGPYKSFTMDVWFGFHASWYVPWVGDDGAICIAGGADHNHSISTHTQCYDLADGTFNTMDADLGQLPEPWWGMADGWQIEDGEYQIWMANGVAQDGTLLPASVYATETSGGFLSGPDIPVGLYRVEGTGFHDRFMTVNGSKGGFWESKHFLQLEPCPTCYHRYLPMVIGETGP